MTTAPCISTWRSILIGAPPSEDGTASLKTRAPFIPKLLMYRRLGNGAFHVVLTYHRKDGTVEEPLMRLSHEHPDAVDIGPILVKGQGPACISISTEWGDVLDAGEEIHIKVDPPQRASFILEGRTPPDVSILQKS